MLKCRLQPISDGCRMYKQVSLLTIVQTGLRRNPNIEFRQKHVRSVAYSNIREQAGA